VTRVSAEPFAESAEKKAGGMLKTRQAIDGDRSPVYLKQGPIPAIPIPGGSPMKKLFLVVLALSITLSGCGWHHRHHDHQGHEGHKGGKGKCHCPCKQAAPAAAEAPAPAK
jgi:hypothetical protein